RDVLERPHVRRPGAVPGQDDLLQRPHLLGIDAETAAGPVDADLAGSHAVEGTASTRRAIAASTRTNAGSSFGISIRARRRPRSCAFSWASVSRSQGISRW